jgi:hypothetical protein
VKKRKHPGRWSTFRRRYVPLPTHNEDDWRSDIDDSERQFMRSWQDPEVCRHFDEKKFEYVWTVVEGDTGRLYVVPGFHTVNYVGRILCAVPYGEVEESNPGYHY